MRAERAMSSEWGRWWAVVSCRVVWGHRGGHRVWLRMLHGDHTIYIGCMRYKPCRACTWNEAISGGADGSG